MLEAALLGFLNRLLGQEPWARERLVPFAGHTVEIQPLPFPPFRVTVREDGLCAREASEKRADAIVTLRPGAIDVSGDERFAETVRFLVKNLRWDLEEEMSRFMGDIPARRIAQGASDFAAWRRDAASRAAESFGRYLVDEARMLVPRA